MARIPGLYKLGWTDVLPEYDPYKYNSFATNAGDPLNYLEVIGDGKPLERKLDLIDPMIAAGDEALLNPRTVVSEARQDPGETEEVDVQKKFGERVPESEMGEPRRGGPGRGGGPPGGIDATAPADIADIYAPRCGTSGNRPRGAAACRPGCVPTPGTSWWRRGGGPTSSWPTTYWPTCPT